MNNINNNVKQSQNNNAVSSSNVSTQPKSTVIYRKLTTFKTNQTDDTALDLAVINISRVTKVVKGGRRFRFSALVAVGNYNNIVGLGSGKAREVSDAVKKAKHNAIKHTINVANNKHRTISYECVQKFNSTKILFKPAKSGCGLIAGGSIRTILRLSGIQNVYTKKLTGKNKINMAKATFTMLSSMSSRSDIYNLRNDQTPNDKELTQQLA